MKQKTFTRKSNYSLLAPMQELPGLITACPRCGGELELWSGERETVCLFCGYKVFERETTSH